MEQPSISYTSTLRTLYADTDQMGIIHNSRYLVYFEVARTDMLRSYGLPYRMLEESGLVLPVLESNVKYISPARFDDILSITTEMPPFEGIRMRLNYEVYCEDRHIATGFTRHVFAHSKTLRPVRPPKTFMEVIQQQRDKRKNDGS